MPLNRWVRAYAGLLEQSFRRSYKRSTGRSWRMDETYILCKGKWVYLYRALDKEGNTIDFKLSRNRDAQAAKALQSSGLPDKVVIDKSSANALALNLINQQLTLCALMLLSTSVWQAVLNMTIAVKQSKYLNNLIEQDHRRIKRITRPMLGFKSFCSAKATLLGIELHAMLRKQQHIHSKTQTLFQQFYALVG